MNDSEATNQRLARRDFVTAGMLGSTLAAGSGLLTAAPTPASGPEPSKPKLDGALPKAKIGRLEVSRLMFGGNITSAWMHARDLSYVAQLARHYNTDEKILVFQDAPSPQLPHRAEAGGTGTQSFRCRGARVLVPRSERRH